MSTFTGLANPWKGKGKANGLESDFDDLTPAITYRHLHAQHFGPKDPLRAIALCDSDAFYATCEQVRLKVDPAVPLVVRQWDSLIAVNYPARKFGISRMDRWDDALKKCPELKIVHVATYKEGDDEPGYWEKPDTRTHKVSLDHYRRESAKIYNMFKEGLPGTEIEKASIDEAFIDFTRPVREKLLERFPYLAKVPDDAPDGLDSTLPPPPPISWDGLGTLIPLHPARDNDDAEVELLEDDLLTTWSDVALSIAAEMMGRVRADIHAKLGYTLSAGLARNKFLAKLSASYRKPNDQSILRNLAIPGYLRPMPFQKIRFLGGKLGKALAEEYDVKTVGDLLSITLEEMQRKFGEESIWVYEILRGIDRTDVKEKSATTKSMAASKNLTQPVAKASEGSHWIRILAAELALRLNEARDQTPGLWPKSIVLGLRQGWQIYRSKQAPFPFSRTVTIDLIAAAGDKLWKELIGFDDSRPLPMKITHVGLSFTGIASNESGQQNIEGFFKDSDVSVKAEDRGTKRKLHSIVEEKHASEEITECQPSRSAIATHFDCGRCGRRIHISDDLAGIGIEDYIKQQALAALRTEHEDFHLALDLSKLPEDGVNAAKFRPDPPQKKFKKPKSKPEPKPDGIAKFLVKK
ncbi:DNA polymerase eta [Neolentinus lepideus HHB14362 ss-1]|uniref:DNA polymerase eta n=1 Tax=Neolentinus lepideus HHB14362 ss-1 TaxID=1314782 RepID=A0A165VGN4_9AGAM|nr:DNA polymerase eta [Neolentinus lepideus HHB14362 ss-1]